MRREMMMNDVIYRIRIDGFTAVVDCSRCAPRSC
jgi:hypothetical protein